jgi:hypothetical protein
MTASPLTPLLTKGALVTLGRSSALADVIVFQYNPATLSRSLEAQTGSEGGDRSEALRLHGAPAETISLTVEIDAADQLETGDQTAQRLGIYPQLSALELLLYPPTSLVVANTALMALGTIEVVPPMAPLTVFVWGAGRVVPVRLSSYQVREEAHDAHLNPIRADVELSLRVLSYSDLPITHPGYHLFLAHQIVKETMAALSGRSGLDTAGGAINSLLA